MIQNLYGLIGFPLGHSFSKGFFTEKFKKLGLSETHSYELFEISDIQTFPELLKNYGTQLKGINVTIPHKKAIMPFLDALDSSAERVGAVNVIKFKEDGKLIGYNSDYYGFKLSLEEFLNDINSLNALILGNGGASKAVQVALDDLGITWKTVSRKPSEGELSYKELNESIFNKYKLIINTSPVGTYPNIENCPNIPYQFLTEQHYLYDLVYNPAETLFMKFGLEKGAKVHNGLKMLHLQAEKAWEIWNS